MQKPFVLSLSAIVLMGLSTVAYGGWTWFSSDADVSKSRPKGAIPNGDCLEMICEHGCVENSETGYMGYCCPTAGGHNDSCRIAGKDVSACCQSGACINGKCGCEKDTDCSGEQVCNPDKTCGCPTNTTLYTKSNGATGCCPNDRWTGTECLECPEGWHLDGSICCPFGQGNKDGKCTCENPKNNCGTSCCNGAWETCRDPEKGVCCAHELCGGVCCPTGSICQDNQCTNPCQEGEHIVDYFDKSGVKKQTCCPTDSMGADWSGACCPEGLVGAFGHNHNWSYISRCCPKEGQEDKGMVGLRGLAETYGCAPPDTTMDASQKIGLGGTGHTWYAPRGSKNVRADGWACAPEEKRGGVLHVSCGAGVVCRHGWKKGRDCSYCYGEVDANNICQLPDCAKPREHIGYCYCNPENGSVTEYNYYTGGTWASSYPNDVCVTPQDGSKTPKCTKGYTFYNKTYGCMSCETYLGQYPAFDKDTCLNCSQAIWNNNKCSACPNGKKPNSNRDGCE